jgi:hypothetical protein
MNTIAFVTKLKKFRGRYKEISTDTGVNYDVVRKYAQGVLPGWRLDNVKLIANWMKGRRP